MRESETDEKKQRIDMIYRNLEHASSCYFEGDSVFPLWESAFALIIGQIFIAYFDRGICPIQETWLIRLGAILSLIWFLLVSLNLQNAYYMERSVKKLQRQLNEEIKIDPDFQYKEFIKPWPSQEDKSKWTLSDIFWGTKPKGDCEEKPKENDWFKSRIKWFRIIIKSTWFYRRILSLILFLFWIYIDNSGIFLVIMAIIVIWFIKFDPKVDADPTPIASLPQDSEKA